MSHIVRDRLWDGLTDIDGHNPHAIQGFQIPNSEQFQGGITKDFLDLTDHLGVIPEELAYQRYACPLLGGDMTVESQGEINDFTETHPDMIPENRQQECPNITIGKAGTLDAKLTCGSIFVNPYVNDDAGLYQYLQQAITNNLQLTYNYGDYDDPRAPTAEVIVLRSNVQSRLPKSTRGGKRLGRCVVMVTILDETNLIAAIRAKRADPHCKGMHISDPVRRTEMTPNGEQSRIVTWLEIMLVETEPTAFPQKIKVSGASYLHSGGDWASFQFLHSHTIHPEMDIPAERMVISVPINGNEPKEMLKKYAVVPIWDYIERTVEYDPHFRNVACSILFNYYSTGTHQMRIIACADGEVDQSPIKFFQIFPITPVTARRTVYLDPNSQHFSIRGISILSTPMLLFGGDNPVLRPIRIEAYLESGYHFRWRPDPNNPGSVLRYTSEWTGTTPLNAVDLPERAQYKGQWKLGISMIKVTAISGTATGSTLIPWMGVPLLDDGVNPLQLGWLTLVNFANAQVNMQYTDQLEYMAADGYSSFAAQPIINWLPKLPEGLDSQIIRAPLQNPLVRVYGTPPFGSEGTYRCTLVCNDGWNTVATEERTLIIDP